MNPKDNKDQFSNGFKDVQESFFDLCSKLESTQQALENSNKREDTLRKELKETDEARISTFEKYKDLKEKYLDIKCKLRGVMTMELAPTPAFQNLKPIEFEEDENDDVKMIEKNISLSNVASPKRKASSVKDDKEIEVFSPVSAKSIEKSSKSSKSGSKTGSVKASKTASRKTSLAKELSRSGSSAGVRAESQKISKKKSVTDEAEHEETTEEKTTEATIEKTAEKPIEETTAETTTVDNTETTIEEKTETEVVENAEIES